MCPLYVAGLIGPGDRKSVGPMAERIAPGDYDQLHHFVSDGVWDDKPLELELARQTEGQICKLKLVKRQMYGRGKLDLLQARVIGLA